MHSISINITKKEEIDKVSDASDADGPKGEHHDEVSWSTPEGVLLKHPAVLVRKNLKKNQGRID